MQVTVTEAKNRFSSLCAQINQQADSLSARKQVFESEFSQWIAAQNAWVEYHGVPGEDLRPW